VVLNHSIRVNLAGALFCFFFILLVSFISTVLFAVSYQVSFGLFRWEFRRSRFF
jgi:hypothetical protein